MSDTISDAGLKFCKDCKHLLGRRTATEMWEAWKCAAPQNKVTDSINLVNGDHITKYRITYCVQCRSSPITEGCAPEALWYELYEKPAIYEELAKRNSDPTNLAEQRAKRDIKKGVTADDL